MLVSGVFFVFGKFHPSPAATSERILEKIIEDLVVDFGVDHRLCWRATQLVVEVQRFER